MEKYDFPSAVHLETAKLDDKILNWARETGLFSSDSECSRYKDQRINWFAGYLFPQEDGEKLEDIMGFFFHLFLLDDLLDKRIDQKMLSFLKSLESFEFSEEEPLFGMLGNGLKDFHTSYRNLLQDSRHREAWEECWISYLRSLQWELENKLHQRMPSLLEYRLMRPWASGVFLAIFFLRKDRYPDSCHAELLEYDIARFICLGNDLASFPKEFAVGDFHNELVLLGGDSYEKVVKWVKRELKSLHKRIHVRALQIAHSSDSCHLWIEELLLMLGGCLFWTEETTRYVTSNNGKSTGF